MTNNNGMRPKQDSYKRWFDLSVLILAHAFLLPLWVVLWIVIPILIWTGDRGPIFYRQNRLGKDRNPFTVLKFRTMIVDAEIRGPTYTTDGDPRITRVGRVLRRTALDELPEIISIWKGDMSFVGPRALAIDEHQYLEKLMPGFEKRLQVRPGLTGLAQVYDKGDDPFKKYKYDMEYLRKLNPAMDAKLMILSVLNTLIARWDHRSGKVFLENSSTQHPVTPNKSEHSEITVQEKNNGRIKRD